MYLLGELATRLDLALVGRADREIHSLAPLTAANAQQLSFLASPKLLSQLHTAAAGAVIVRPEHAEQCPVDVLIAEDPYAAYARATHLFERPRPQPGIHPSAVVSPAADVHGSVSVAANAIIEAGAVLAENVVIGAGVFIGADSVVGAGTRIYPNAVLYHDVQVGANCTIQSQAVLGADGFGYAPSAGGWEKICQLGGVRVGDRVEIGACTAVDRGALEHTVIEDGVIIDNHVHIAHNCSIGKNTAIAACCGIAGSTKIGANCVLAGKVGVTGHIEICDNVHLSAMSMVTKSVTEPGHYSSGTAITTTAEWRKNAVRFSQLDALARRLSALEKKK